MLLRDVCAGRLNNQYTTDSLMMPLRDSLFCTCTGPFLPAGLANFIVQFSQSFDLSWIFPPLPLQSNYHLSIGSPASRIRLASEDTGALGILLSPHCQVYCGYRMRVFPATDPSARLLQWQQHLLFAQEIISVRYSANGSC